MLRYRDQYPASWRDRAAHRAQHRLVVSHVFDDVVGTDEVEGGFRRDGASIQLSKFHALRQPRAGMGEPPRMQIGADHAVPAAAALKRLEDGAITAADFQVAPRLREIFVGESDNELVASDEPEMPALDFGQPVEGGRIEAARGVGKVRREHRNAERFWHRLTASLAMPRGRPDGFAPPDRFAGAASRAESLCHCVGSIHRASALTVTPAMMSAMPSSWAAGNGSPNSAVAPIGTNTKLSAMNG